MADISKIKLPDGTTYNIKDTNTTYTLSVSGNNIVLTPSSGSANTITVPYATSAGSATDNTKLPIAGGTMTGALTPNGGINFTSAGLPPFAGSPPFYLGIEAFDDGGQVKWQLANNCSVGYANSAGSAGSAAPTSGSTYYIQNCVQSSRSTATPNSWLSMVNSSAEGNPVPPTTGWWTVLSADCWGGAPYYWVSQLALATQETSGVWWRRNDSHGTSIDLSTWHRLAEGDSDGNASVANKLGSSNVGGGDQPIYLNGGTPTACNYRIPEVRQYVRETPSSSKSYPILTSYNDTALSSDTEVNYVNKQLDLLYDPKLKKLSCGQIVTDLAAVGNITDGYATISPTQSYLPNEIITGNVNCNSMSVADISDQYTITKSSGSWVLNSFTAYRTGSVIQIQLNFRGSGSVVSGGTTAFKGTITAGPKPVLVSSGARASTNHNAVATITSTGDITVVNTVDNWNLSTSTNLGIPVVFITED